MPGDGGNRDERKSASGVNSAYGGTSRGGSGYSQQDEQVKNPFGTVNWGHMGGGSASRGGGGIPLPGAGNGSQFMDPRFAPTATDILPATNAGSPALAGWDEIRRRFTNPRGLVDLAGLIPALLSLRGGGGGGDNPFGSGSEDILAEMTRSLALQRQRLEQAQPVYDNLVRMATNAAPNANYGGAAYQYRGPRFGG